MVRLKSGKENTLNQLLKEVKELVIVLHEYVELMKIQIECDIQSAEMEKHKEEKQQRCNPLELLSGGK